MGTKTKPSKFVGIRSRTVCNRSGGVTSTSTVPIVTDTSSTITGVSVPKYRSIIAAGGNATSDMDAVERTASLDKPLSWNFRFSSGNYYGYSSYGEYTGYEGPLGSDTSMLTIATNGARAKAYSELRSGFNSFAFIGELRESIAMIRSPALGLRKGLETYLREAKRLRKKFSVRTSQNKMFRDAISDLWLEYSFGWVPLMMDIKLAYESAVKTVENKQFIPFKGTYRLNHKSTHPDTVYPSDGSLIPRVVIKYSGEHETSVAYSGMAYVQPGFSARGFNFGATLPDFVPAGWELCPWSFLIDYFTNVGDVLDSWATAQAVGFSFVSYTTRVRSTYRSEMKATHEGSPKDPRVYTGSASYSCKTIKRRKANDVPLPELQIDAKLSTSRGLNIAALFQASIFDSRFKR